MSRLTNPHTRRKPTEYRVTVMETPEDQHYYGRTYDNYPNSDGTVTRYVGDGYETERVPFMGMYLIEDLGSNGQPNGTFDLITYREFLEQFKELGDCRLDYGVRAMGGSEIQEMKNVEGARIHVKFLQYKKPAGKFEVVSRPAGSDGEWTVVGR